jgi:hypothetical protein
MHEIVCPHCGHTHSLSEEKVTRYAGKMAQCVCGQTFRIELQHPAATSAPTPLPHPEPISEHSQVAAAESPSTTMEDEMLHAIMSAPPTPALPPSATSVDSGTDNVGFSPSANELSSSFPESTRRPPLSYRRRSNRLAGPSPFWDFLVFRRMITVGIVAWVFLLGSIAWVLLMLYTALNIASGYWTPDEKLKWIAVSFLAAFVGVAILRLICEFAVVVFRINETLTEIKNQRYE